jgi:FkbM family methyltransferase
MLTWIRERRRLVGNTPRFIANWPLWALRRALHPYFMISFWARTPSGAKLWLGPDRVDETILRELHERSAQVYFSGFDLSPGDIVLDIGGHHGFFAVELVRRFPGIFVITVEPDPGACRLIRRNVARNGLSAAIEIHECGIAATAGAGYLVAAVDGSWANHTTLDATAAGRPIVLRRLDAILKGRTPRLVKINAEGAEFAAVPQLLDLERRPQFLIVMGHPEHGPVAELVGRLGAAGYASEELTVHPSRPCWRFARGATAGAGA